MPYMWQIYIESRVIIIKTSLIVNINDGNEYFNKKINFKFKTFHSAAC
jgi:hypothetical protein